METFQASKGLSRAELIQRLIESKLLSAEEVDQVCGPAMDAAADANQLAHSLVSTGVLTGYQVEIVRSRQYAELRIGNYDILDRLGAGGMGAVFKARHRRMKRIVALKVLSQSLCRDAKFVERFQREVETIARLAHPNVVMAHDADEGEMGHFLVMEYVSGADLATLVAKHGPFALAVALSCMVQAARGLAYAHGQNIIHRDIKPANLLRDAAGVVKVTDLGLARFSIAASDVTAAAGTPGSLTQAGGVLGTVDYMPPEQALDSTTIDHRADIYALGATLHFLLLGKAPYETATMMATLLKHRDAPIPSLCAARSDVPAALDAVFRRMLAKAPADRYQTMAEALGDLESIQASLGDAGALPPIDIAMHPGEAGSSTLTEARQSLEQTIAAPRGQRAGLDLPPPPAADGKVRSVLLVEPSRTQSGIIRKYLQSAGVEQVVAVASGREALDAASAAHCDAIVSALHLADMTGIELAAQIHGKASGAVPGFVLISSESESKETAPFGLSAHTVVLQKPFTPEMLAQALSRAALARVSKPASQVRPAPTAATGGRGLLRVLIADDSTPARLHIRRTLEGLGFAQFVETADGAQAVAAAARDTFHLIVTDYNMPFLDGQALVGYLKQNPATATVPIIMVTTEQDPSKLEAVRRLGVAAICDKRFDSERVRGIIDPLM